MSLALCLHFNEHVTEISLQEHDYVDAIHSHHHEVNQQYSHSHQDNLYEHFVGYEAIKAIAVILLLLSIRIFDRTKNYIFLMASRIFKPPKTSMSSQFIIYFGV
ncbi:hypothetical protein [Stenotrophomonas maltophilia]|uniref:hypothetical protein n=1 Tax=Stenotrophomonas maltophilia TaxID=40324 RepID=UPI003BF845FF